MPSLTWGNPDFLPTISGSLVAAIAAAALGITMSVTYAAALNVLLNSVGLHLLRRSTLDQLTSAACNGHMIESDTKPLPAPADDDPALDDPVLDDPALRANADAHNFRKVALAGEQMEQVTEIIVSHLRGAVQHCHRSPPLVSLDHLLAGFRRLTFPRSDLY
ncbi:hypothetical protein [Bradyrhizobium oligotrophicum]|uniref:hypothetical protein n=1 Tax=Bradyrhizobium oligotrophicum TaxID=44255 RepID=UPI001181A63E|nr:hypothetical protein [Bradyrhizobium oligotrophicum]